MTEKREEFLQRLREGNTTEDKYERLKDLEDRGTAVIAARKEERDKLYKERHAKPQMAKTTDMFAEYKKYANLPDRGNVIIAARMQAREDK